MYALCMPTICMLQLKELFDCFNVKHLWRALGGGGWERGKYYNQPRKPATDKRNSISVNGNKRKAWMQSN